MLCIGLGFVSLVVAKRSAWKNISKIIQNCISDCISDLVLAAHCPHLQIIFNAYVLAYLISQSVFCWVYIIINITFGYLPKPEIAPALMGVLSPCLLLKSIGPAYCPAVICKTVTGKFGLVWIHVVIVCVCVVVFVLCQWSVCQCVHLYVCVCAR